MKLAITNAPKGYSIWDELDELTFQRAVQKLESTKAHVPAPFTLAQSAWPTQSEGYTLTFGEEQQLANSVAFIAAYKAGAPFVVACAVQEVEGALVVRVAANKGLEEKARCTLRYIVQVMSRCAAKGECSWYVSSNCSD